MGAACSTSYYFGFVNFSFSHLDVLSFALGCLFAVGMQYLVAYCRMNKKANLHVLGKKKAARGVGMESAVAAAGGQQPGYYPYPSYPNYPMPRPMPLYPDPGQASAPAPAGTTIIPWKLSSA